MTKSSMANQAGVAVVPVSELDSSRRKTRSRSWSQVVIVGELDGEVLGVAVGVALEGDAVGKTVGSEVVGSAVGDAVGSEVVGSAVGDAEGSDMVGSAVGGEDGVAVGAAVGTGNRQHDFSQRLCTSGSSQALRPRMWL